LLRAHQPHLAIKSARCPVPGVARS
jgi:hypothetical protein